MPTKHNIFTPIYVAIKSGSLEKLKLILDHGGSVGTPCGPRHKKSEVYKAKFLESTNPLQLALDLYEEDKSEKHASMVKMLISRGANPNLTISDGTNASHIADTVQQHNDSMAPSKLNTFANVMIQISKAFAKNHFEHLGWVIFFDESTTLYSAQCKAFTNEADAKKQLQLLQAQFPCAHLKLDKMKFRLCVPDLAQRLIEVNIGEKLRFASAHATSYNDEYETLVQQAKSCGSINHPGPNTNKTALHQAVRSGDLKKVESLLKAGADQSKKDNDNYTALDLAMPLHEDIAAILRDQLQTKKL